MREALALLIEQPEQGKFLQKIGWNKEEITQKVTEITKYYENAIYTDEQIQDAKRDRATLNSMRNDISDRRIEVKKAIMAPYNMFEAEIKEVVALIDKPIAMIDKQTAAYEEKLKEEKKNELVNFFKDNIGEFEDVLTFDVIFNPKWLNKTTSLKSCKDDISKSIEKISTDIRAMETVVEDKYREYAKDFYFRRGMNMTTVLEEIGRMKEVDRKAKEERIAREEAEERRREQEAAKEAEATNTPTESENVPDQSKDTQVVDPFADKDTDTKIYKAHFTIRGTKAQILSVKEFMITNNIQFGKVEK